MKPVQPDAPENLSGLNLHSFDNLLLAYRKAAKGKRGHADVAAFEYHLEENLFQLQQELRDKTYQPGGYHSFYIHDPKKRLISAAPFRDRVVHHALCNLIEPVFEKSFIFDSYANRIGKGTHKAIDRAQQFARRYPYVLTCDIRQFFPSMDHAVLFNILSEKIKDQTLLWLAGVVLKSGEGVLHEEYEMVYFEGDDLLAAQRPRGLPIGNLTSQFWANCYLNPFDHFIKRELKCRGYVRYVDDFLLFSENLPELNQWRKGIVKRLKKYRLTLHENKCQPRRCAEGIPFLGFVIFSGHRKLKRRKGIAFQRKFRSMQKAYKHGELSFEKMSASIQGWVNHVRFANTWGLRLSLLTHYSLLPIH